MNELYQISKKYNKDLKVVKALYEVSMSYSYTHTQAIENIEEFLNK